MKRRLICLIGVLAMILAMQTTVFAHNILDWTQDGLGSITIHLEYAPETADCGSLRLYRVGDVQEIWTGMIMRLHLTESLLQ